MERLPQPRLPTSSTPGGTPTFWAQLKGLTDDIRHTWNLVQDHPSPFLSKDVQYSVLDVILDSRTAVHLRSQRSDSCDTTHASICPRMFAQLVADLVMIHDQLFVMQTLQRVHGPYITPLTEMKLRLVLNKYNASQLRRNLWSSIQKSDFSGAVDFKGCVGRIVLEAVNNNKEHVN